MDMALFFIIHYRLNPIFTQAKSCSAWQLFAQPLQKIGHSIFKLLILNNKKVGMKLAY
jgi:cell division inhibitor SulA